MLQPTPRRGRRRHKPPHRWPKGLPKLPVYDRLTAWGAAPPVATGKDTACTPDLAPSGEGGGVGGGRVNRVAARVDLVTAAELTSPRQCLSLTQATATRGVG
jgi:hypothetical protein